jgi:hypothetical protein
LDLALRSIRIEHVCDDFQIAEYSTADCADNADKGRRISDYPRHPRHLRSNALAGLSVAVSDRGRIDLGWSTYTPLHHQVNL